MLKWGLLFQVVNSNYKYFKFIYLYIEKTKLHTKEYRLEYGPVMIKRIKCDGTENNLLECRVRYIGTKRRCDITDDIFSLHCVDG